MIYIHNNINYLSCLVMHVGVRRTEAAEGLRVEPAVFLRSNSFGRTKILQYL